MHHVAVSTARGTRTSWVPCRRIGTTGPPGLYRTAAYPQRGIWPRRITLHRNRSQSVTGLSAMIRRLTSSADLQEALFSLPQPRPCFWMGVVVSCDCCGGTADGVENPLRRYCTRPWVGKCSIGGWTNPVELDVKRSTPIYGFRASRPVRLPHPVFLLAFPLGVPRRNARKF